MSGMPEGVRLRFRTRAKLDLYRRRVDWARRRIERWLTHCSMPYIAFSGGKDSTCVLHLVRETAPDVPAVYFDADCSFPGVAELIAGTPNVLTWRASEPFLDTLVRVGLDDPRLGDETMRTTVWEPIRRLLAERNYDGVAYGLRSEEDRGRAMHALRRGPVFQYRRDGVWGCQPIHDWSYDDVWAYIMHNRLRYAKTYDRMWHMPEAEQRVSYWAGETARTHGRWAWLKQIHPELWRELVTRIPEASQYA